jgi:hypothetical protein
MAYQRDDAWDALRERLPGLRRPPLAPGLDRREVGALLARIEADVARDPARAFEWDADGTGRLVAAAAGRSYRAGRFGTPSIGELEARIRQRATPAGAVGALSFSVVLGEHALTDIGALQAMAGPGTLFQVASQFNCLEAPGPSIVPIANYVSDNTQGPRASVSAFPGTFLRHYAAPRINLLADAVDPAVAQVQSGYLTAWAVSDPLALDRALARGFDNIRVGVHDDVEVVFGGNWGGPVDPEAPTIAQVFTSTMALGGYSGGAGDEFAGACAWLLRAAYLGTLLAAIDLGKRTVVLTLIGGGAFDNSIRSIWDAIVWAIDRAAPFASSDLTVVLNARRMSAGVPGGEIAEAARVRNGTVITL